MSIESKRWRASQPQLGLFQADQDLWDPLSEPFLLVLFRLGFSHLFSPFNHFFFYFYFFRKSILGDFSFFAVYTAGYIMMLLWVRSCFIFTLSHCIFPALLWGKNNLDLRNNPREVEYMSSALPGSSGPALQSRQSEARTFALLTVPGCLFVIQMCRWEQSASFSSVAF